MAIESGIGWTAYAVDDSGGSAREMNARITTANFNVSRGIQDITTLADSARATLQLLADCQDNMTVLFDDATDNSFDVFKTAGSATGGRTITRTHSGQTLATESNLSGVNFQRSQGGELLLQVTAVLQDGAVPTWT
jgi:hypothetical protein